MCVGWRLSLAALLVHLGKCACFSFSFDALAHRVQPVVSLARSHICLIGAEDEPFDMNSAVTALNAAVAAEDYAEAARLKKMISEAAPDAADSSSWPGGDSFPDWLLERLEALSYRYPTPIQSVSVRTVRDAVLRAPTGSGKTLAYLVPLISKAVDALGKRSQATSEAVASMDLSPTDALGALAPALSTGRPLDNPFAAIAGGGATLVGGVPTRGSPLMLVLVPRDTLSEQVAAIVYSMLGGYARASRSWQPGASDSLFKYRGPKGARVCILRAESDEGTMRKIVDDCDVLITTPNALKALQRAEAEWRERADTRRVVDALIGVAIDEADACLSDEPSLCDSLLAHLPVDCARLLVGATVSDALVAEQVKSGWLRDPELCDGAGELRASLDANVEGAGSAVGGGATIPASVIHQASVADADGTQLALLSRLMRTDLRAWEQLAASDTSIAARPRCVVFARSEESAAEVSRALRSSLWGDHAIAVLLPTQGENPSMITNNFRRAAGAEGGFASMAQAQGGSVLVAPASAARGLDFVNVSHVYTIGVSVADGAEYAHIAGRTGRVGQAGRGVVTSLVRDADEVARLRGIVEDELGRTLLVGANSVTPEELAAGESADDVIRRLDDTLLLDVDDDGSDGEADAAK